MPSTSKIEANQGTKTSQSERRADGHGRFEHTTVGRAISDNAIEDLYFALRNSPLLICVDENPSLEDL
ncbi:hypothetical protein V2G26_012258 [Clonostachys chloroleuca]